MSTIQLVMLGTSILGAVAGVVGSFAVLRRRALVGDLMSHAALPGLCLAFLLLGRREFGGMLAGAFVTGLAAVAFTTLVVRWTRTKQDAAIGIALSTFFGVGLVLSSIIQQLETDSAKAGLQTYIYGQAAGMSRGDVLAIATVAGACLALIALLYKEFKLLNFDPGFAQAQGWPVLRLDLLLMATLAVVTVVGLPAVGVVLMAAMLITPPAAARFWTDRLGQMLLLAGIFGAASGLIGTLVSAGIVQEWIWPGAAGAAAGPHLPTGPTIVLAGACIFLFSLIFAPKRGIVGRAVRLAKTRGRVADDHLLRSLYELGEAMSEERPAIATSQLANERRWTEGHARRVLARAARRGLVEIEAGTVRLTPAGFATARRLTRAHRLWEHFLIADIDLAPDHVDRDADSVEHFLGDEILSRLERELAAVAPGSLRADELPESPHELSGQSHDSTSTSHPGDVQQNQPERPS